MYGCEEFPRDISQEITFRLGVQSSSVIFFVLSADKLGQGCEKQ